jgi:hypothetical protein
MEYINKCKPIIDESIVVRTLYMNAGEDGWKVYLNRGDDSMTVAFLNTGLITIHAYNGEFFATDSDAKIIKKKVMAFIQKRLNESKKELKPEQDINQLILQELREINNNIKIYMPYTTQAPSGSTWCTNTK